MFGRKYLVVAALFGVMLLVGASASSVTNAGTASNGSKRLKFAFLVPELADAYWAAGEKGAKAEAAKDNIDLKITGTTTFTPSAYNSTLQDEIAAGVDGILLAPGDPVASNALIKKAVAKHIVVATVIVDAPKSARKFFIGPNATQFGVEQAHRVITYLHAKKAKGEVQAAILSCSPTAISQVDEHLALVKVMTHQNPYTSQFHIKVVTFLNSTADPTTNLAVYQNLATAYPDLKVVIGECGLDPVSMGLVNQRRHLHWIVVGDSFLPQTLRLLKAGYVTWTMNEEPYETLQAAIKSLADGIRGTAPMPSGIQTLHYAVAVSNLAYMKSIHLPGKLMSVDTALKSPDAVG